MGENHERQLVIGFTRRSVAVGLPLAATLHSRRTIAAEARGLFWSATPPGKSSSILFGYARTALSIAPDIVRDGERLMAGAQRLLGDVPNVQYAQVAAPRDRLKPILSRVSPDTAGRIRAVLAGSFAALPARDTISGVELAVLMLGEGQTPAQPSVGGTIVEQARAAGKPIEYLVSADEAKAAFRPPDLVTLDERVDEAVCQFMLNLRDKVGPIGKYLETLYRTRQSDELARVTADLTQHGVPQSRDLLPTGAMEETIVARAMQRIQTASEALFLLVPVGTLTGDAGLVARLRTAGVSVAAIA